MAVCAEMDLARPTARAVCDYVESWGFYRSVFVIQPGQQDHAMPAQLSLDIRLRFQRCIEEGLSGRVVDLAEAEGVTFALENLNLLVDHPT